MQPLLAILLVVAAQSLPANRAEETARAFAFVSQQIVITAEPAGPHSFVLNFVNLSDFVMVVQPNEFIYKGASGRYYIGQVFEKESRDNRGQVFKFSASMLLKSKSFAGLTVLGDFQELEGIAELSVRIGAKRFYLEPMGQVEFEVLGGEGRGVGVCLRRPPRGSGGCWPRTLGDHQEHRWNFGLGSRLAGSRAP